MCGTVSDGLAQNTQPIDKLSGKRAHIVNQQAHYFSLNFKFKYDYNALKSLLNKSTFCQSVNSISLVLSVLPPVIFIINWISNVCHQL